MDEVLRTTPLTEQHVSLEAKLGPFAGWSMPIRFTSTLAEHAAVREDVGVFDVSHLGTIAVEGPRAEAAVAGTFTNDPAVLVDGSAQYTLCCDASGGVIDDLIVYRLDEERFLAVPNAANTAAVLAALRDAAGTEAQVEDVTDRYAVIALQGPRSLALADQVFADLGAGPEVASGTAPFAVTVAQHGDHDLLVCGTGYTGERGVELLVAAEDAVAVWTALLEAGATPCGLGARDTLRLEMGYPLHGNELSRDVLPYEARLGWAVKLDRAAFRGRDALLAAKDAGPRRRLWGIVAEGRRPARSDLSVLAPGTDEVVGRTTSGTLSPTLRRPIALAYLDVRVGPGDEVDLDVRGDRARGRVVKPPFVDRARST
ncbi:MAG: glycine cleavage system aminomethyltransferase GcvT [Nitriliruptoraceae bacterium]